MDYSDTAEMGSGLGIVAYCIFTARKRSLGQGNIFTPVCHSVHRGGVGLVSQHAPGSHYIRSCTGAATQLVWRQHTGNIKCMMG